MEYYNDNISLESIFANAEQQAESLIDQITASINEKVNDIDAAEALVLSLSNEAARFNKILISIDNTNAQVESGDITKEQALSTLAPLVKELKDQCTALHLSGAEMSEDDDIDTNEIAVLREIIIGAKAAAEKRVVDLRTDADLSPDTESVSTAESAFEDDDMISIESYIEYLRNGDIANEGFKDFVNNVKQNYKDSAKEKPIILAKAAELRALDDDKLLKVVVKGLVDHSNIFGKPEKTDAAKQSLKEMCAIFQENPGTANPSTSVVQTINGYPLIVVYQHSRVTDIWYYYIDPKKGPCYGCVSGVNDMARVCLGIRRRSFITKKAYSNVNSAAESASLSDADLSTATESLKDKLNEFKQNRAEAKDESNSVNAKVAELRSMSPEQVATLVIKAIASSREALDNICKLSKDPEAKELVEKTASEWAANPGKINPTTTKYMTIAGYPVFVVTKKDKKTGNEVFASLGYGIQFLKDQVFAGQTVSKAGTYDIDAIFGYKEAARMILGTPRRHPITKKRIPVAESFIDEEYVESLESVIDIATEYCDNIEDASDYALEAVNRKLYKSLKKSTEAQAAATLVRNARKLYNMGSKEKAIEYMKKAQSLYEKCLAMVKKNTQWANAERTETVRNPLNSDSRADKYNIETTSDANAKDLANYFQDKIDTCKSYVIMWKSKNGDLKALKASLRDEQKSESKRIYNEKKGAVVSAVKAALPKKAMKMSATEAVAVYPWMAGLNEADTEELVDLESLMDQLSNVYMAVAIEADGAEDDATEKMTFGAKFRKALSKIKLGKGREAVAEADAALDEAEEAVKKGNLTPAQIAVIAGSLLVVVIAILAAIKLISKKKKSNTGDNGKDLASDMPNNFTQGDVALAKSKLEALENEGKGLLSKIKAARQNKDGNTLKSLVSGTKDLWGKTKTTIVDFFSKNKGAAKSAPASESLSLANLLDLEPATESVQEDDTDSLNTLIEATESYLRELDADLNVMALESAMDVDFEDGLTEAFEATLESAKTDALSKKLDEAEAEASKGDEKSNKRAIAIAIGVLVAVIAAYEIACRKVPALKNKGIEDGAKALLAKMRAMKNDPEKLKGAKAAIGAVRGVVGKMGGAISGAAGSVKSSIANAKENRRLKTIGNNATPEELKALSKVKG